MAPDSADYGHLRHSAADAKTNTTRLDVLYDFRSQFSATGSSRAPIPTDITAGQPGCNLLFPNFATRKGIEDFAERSRWA